MDDHLSDDSYVTDDELQFTLEDEINIYISEYLDTIIDIFFKFEEQFSYTPEFLEYARENSTALASFIIDYIFKNKTVLVYDDTSKFELEYKNEIQISYNVISSFIYWSSSKKLTLKEWIEFCYSKSYTKYIL